MTVSGVPFSPYSDRRFHLFGGRFRTGDPIEYAISALIVMISLTLNAMFGDSFAPYFYDWSGLYVEGIIDASEWKTNRFRLM
jgi:inner membrane protein